MNHYFLIEGQEVDLPANLKLEIIVENNLFEFDNIFSDSSNFFEFPAKETINRILKNANRLAVANNTYAYQARYFHSGVQFYDGKLVVQTFSRLLYKMAFISNGITIDTANKNMRDIAWPQFSRSLFDDTAALTAEMFYPGQFFFDLPSCQAPTLYPSESNFLSPDGFLNTYDTTNQHYIANAILNPWPYVYEVVNHYLKTFGYTITGNFFSSALGKRLQFPSNYLIDANGVGGGRVRAVFNRPDGPYSTQYNAETIIFETEEEDNYNSYNNSTGVFTIQYPGLIRVLVVGLHLEVRRNPNPVIPNSDDFNYKIELRAKGVTIASQEDNNSVSNGASLKNFFVNFDESFMASESDVGKEVRVSLTFSGASTRVSARIRNGNFVVNTEANRESTDFIDSKYMVPNMAFDEFIVQIRKTFPLLVRLNPNNKSIRFDYILTQNKRSTPVDWSAYAGETYEAEVLETGYKLNYNYPQGDIDKLVPIENLVEVERRNVPPIFAPPTPANANNYIYVPLTNDIYKATVIDDFGTLAYRLYSENIYPIQLGNGNQEVIPNLRPVRMKYTFNGFTIPVLDMQGNSEFLQNGNYDFDLLLSIHHGLQPGNKNGAVVLYPYSSPSNLNHIGQEIFPISLYYRDFEKGLYKLYYKEFLTMLVNSLQVQQNFLLPIKQLRQLDLARGILVDNVLMLVKRLVYVLEDCDTDFYQTTVTLAKLDPKSISEIANPPVVADFNCSSTLFINGISNAPTAGINDNVTVVYALNNLSSTKTVGGIANIEFYYVDDFGAETLLATQGYPISIAPLQSTSLTKSIVLSKANYPFLDITYTGKIRVKTAFSTKCNATKDVNFIQAPPELLGTFVLNDITFAEDTREYQYNYFGRAFYQPEEPYKDLINWEHYLELRVDSEVIIRWKFNQTNNNIFNIPFPVEYIKPGIDYATGIAPYFSFGYFDSPSIFYMRFLKIKFAKAYGYVNNGTTDNSKNITLCMRYTTNVRDTGYICAVTPKKYYTVNNLNSKIAIGSDNTVKITSLATSDFSSLSNHQICHEGLIFGSYVKLLELVCAGGTAGSYTYNHNPANALIGNNPDYYIKHKAVTQTDGLINIIINALREQGVNLAYTDVRKEVSFDFFSQILTVRFKFFDNGDLYGNITAATSRVFVGATLNDSGLKTGGFYTVTGGSLISNTTIPSGSYFGTGIDLVLSIAINQAGKYTATTEFSAMNIPLKAASQILIHQA